MIDHKSLTFKYKAEIIMSLAVLHRKDLPLGGFSGLKEHHPVRDPRVGAAPGSAPGLGNFVYLADARFVPFGETRMHPHRELDVISVMVEGRIAHEGSLEHGAEIGTDQVQVQRAGGEGFRHNEINPDSVENRMIQLWVLPENRGEPAGYKVYDLTRRKLTPIYGGTKSQSETFDSHTIIEVGLFAEGDKIAKSEEFVAYMTRGNGIANGQKIEDGDLIRGKELDFTATSSDVQLIIVTVTN
jgi:redox-sensitive bicupin YhaK (pirin superfamily)